MTRRDLLALLIGFVRRDLLALVIGLIVGALAFGGLYAIDRALSAGDTSGPSLGAP